MATEASHEANQNLSVPVVDPVTGWQGRLFEKTVKRAGTFKQVSVPSIMIGLPTGQEVSVGSRGLPVHATIRTDKQIAPLKLLGAIRDENMWQDAFKEKLLNDSGILAKAVLRKIESRDEYSFDQESLPFAHSLGEALKMIHEAPASLLTPDMKMFKTLEHLTKAIGALEEMHKMNFVFDNGVSGIVHGDAGRWHLENFIGSATTGEYRMIDFSHVQKATPELQQHEMRLFSKQVLKFLTDRENQGGLLLLPTKLVDYLQHGGILSSDTLIQFAKHELMQITHAQGISASEAIAYMDERFFLSYLRWQVADQTDPKIFLPTSVLEAIDRKIPDLLSLEDTMEMPAISR